MPSLAPYCRVTSDGIEHVFLAFDLGVTCACGRKLAGLSVEDEAFEIRDVLPQSCLTPGLMARTAATPPPTTAAERLLSRGSAAIRRSRHLRREALAARSRRALGRGGIALA